MFKLRYMTINAMRKEWLKVLQGTLFVSCFYESVLFFSRSFYTPQNLCTLLPTRKERIIVLP